MSPLQQFPLVSTTAPDDAERALCGLFGSCDFGVSRAHESELRATINFCALRQLGLMYGTYGVPLSATLEPCKAYVQGIPLTGGGEQIVGRHHTTISPSDGAIISPGEEVSLRYSGDFDHLVLILKPAAVEDKLTALLGDAPAGPIKMIKTVDYRKPGARAQHRLVNFLARELAKGELPALALEELEQAVLISFLYTNDNNFRSLLTTGPRDCAPSQVRMAEDFIEANWKKAITIEELTRVANTSARSLFRSFGKTRGYSPMAMVKRIRLRHARRMLASPGANTSVTNVAYACGFGNLSHFSQDYCRCFGEHPSETLRAARIS